jgi:hypothetical protein
MNMPGKIFSLDKQRPDIPDNAGPVEKSGTEKNYHPATGQPQK